MIAAALYALAFHLSLPSRLPSDEDYRQVAGVLAREARLDDAVLLFPWWTERARLFLAEDPIVVGYLGSDGDPLVRHPRVWVLAQPHLPRADVEGFWRSFGPGRQRIGQARVFGDLELTLFENGRHRAIAFSAPAEVAAASSAVGGLPRVKVYLETEDGTRISCPLSAANGGFRCPGGPHLYARTEWHEVLYQPRHCLYMHPPGGAGRMVAEFDTGTLGREALLEAGVIWEHAVKRGAEITATTVALEDAASGARLADVVLPPGLEGFQRARVEGDGSPRPLRIAVSSRNPDSRQICVDFTAFAARGGAG
ncbi:MAG TPA: hypothetical protein VE782_11455 [Myxococcaceae bacterium]|nr:hypothetical protein [Myxococcaceae bacterium]